MGLSALQYYFLSDFLQICCLFRLDAALGDSTLERLSGDQKIVHAGLQISAVEPVVHQTDRSVSCSVLPSALWAVMKAGEPFIDLIT